MICCRSLDDNRTLRRELQPGSPEVSVSLRESGRRPYRPQPSMSGHLARSCTSSGMSSTPATRPWASRRTTAACSARTNIPSSNATGWATCTCARRSTCWRAPSIRSPDAASSWTTAIWRSATWAASTKGCWNINCAARPSRWSIVRQKGKERYRAGQRAPSPTCPPARSIWSPTKASVRPPAPTTRPTTIVQYIVEQTVGPVLAERTAAFPQTGRQDHRRGGPGAGHPGDQLPGSAMGSAISWWPRPSISRGCGGAGAGASAGANR